jgi:hypothetical protein
MEVGTMTRRTLTQLLVLVLGTIGVAFWVPTSAASGATPVAQVDVLSPGREQQFDNFSGEVRARCDPGFEFQELSFHGVQGSNVQDWTTSAPGFTCTGYWQRIKYSSGPGFVAGQAATVTARLTVISSTTGDPADQAVDTGSVWVRPATAIVFRNWPTLKPDGTAVVHLKARCDRPWVEPELIVTLTQDNHSSQMIPSMTCTSGFKWFDLRTPAADGLFHKGPARVDGSLIVLDPNSFDPVAATQIFREVGIVS